MTNSGGKSIQLLNPLTGATLPKDFISPSNFNQSALALEKFLPAPIDTCGNFTVVIPIDQYENQFITRIDGTLTPKHSIYGRYFVDGYQTPAFYSPTNILVTGNPGNIERAQTLTIGETWVASSKIVNSFSSHGNAPHQQSRSGSGRHQRWEHRYQRPISLFPLACACRKASSIPIAVPARPASSTPMRSRSRTM